MTKVISLLVVVVVVDFFGEGEGGGNDFTVRASILLHLINVIASRHHFFTLLSGWYLTCKT